MVEPGAIKQIVIKKKDKIENKKLKRDFIAIIIV